MKADLNKTVQFYETQFESSLDSKFFEWKEFDEFQGRLWALEKATAHVQPDFDVQKLMENGQVAKQVLLKSPLHPRMVESLLFVINFSALPYSESSLGDVISAFQIAAKTLLKAENPMSEAAIDLISLDAGITNEFGELEPNIVLIVDRRAREAVIDEWLPELELEAAVSTAQEARLKPPWGTSILFGSPKVHIRTWGQEQVNGVHPASWLINAPTGFDQHVFLTEGSQSFNSSDYSPWPGLSLKKVSCRAKNISPIRSDIVPEWVPQAPSLGPADFTATTGLIPARPILLPDGYWIYFSTNQFGPKPGVVTAGEDGVKFEYCDANQLSRGQFLVIRSISASRDYLRAQAQEYLDRKYGPGTAETYFIALDAFKESVQEYSFNEFAIQNLTNAGFSRSEARRRLNDAWDESVIAPEEVATYNKLCDAVGFTRGRDYWLYMKRIRASMRLAGRIAVRELIQVLKDDDGWPEPVDLGEMYVVSSDDFGEIHIAKIIEVSDSIQDLHLTNLGKLVNPDGTLYEGE